MNNSANKNLRRLAIICSGLLLMTAACEPDYPDNIYDPDDEGIPNPSITSVEPAAGTWAGVGIVTITGQNFSTTLTDNLVHFDGAAGTVLSATETQLEVQTAVVVGDSVKIHVAVIGAYLFAEYEPYKLSYVSIEYGGIDEYSDAYGLAAGSAGNIYASSGTKKIIKIDSLQEQSDFVNPTMNYASGMKMGPEGFLYCAESKFISRVTPEGSYEVPYGGIQKQNTYDLDFDENGNLYVAERQGIVRYDYNLISIRVFEDYVYVAGLYIGADTSVQITKGIWKHQIQNASGVLDSSELAFDWTGYAGDTGPDPLAITFAADGDMYIGSDGDYAVLKLTPDGTDSYMSSVPEPLYPEVLNPPASYFCWGNDHYLYFSNRVEGKMRLIRVDMEKLGAPYHGRP
jgi:hypothetical protein